MVNTNEFIKMSGRCLATQLPQVADNPVCHRWNNDTHFLCHTTCVIGCHLCFICEHSYLTIYKNSGLTLVPCHKCLLCESTLTRTFSLHDHLVAIGSCALHLLHWPTPCKNLCSVGVGATYVTKSAVSQFLSEIELSFRTCLIGNDPQNTLLFFFFQLDICIMRLYGVYA